MMLTGSDKKNLKAAWAKLDKDSGWGSASLILPNHHSIAQSIQIIRWTPGFPRYCNLGMRINMEQFTWENCSVRFPNFALTGSKAERLSRRARGSATAIGQVHEVHRCDEETGGVNMEHATFPCLNMSRWLVLLQTTVL